MKSKGAYAVGLAASQYPTGVICAVLALLTAAMLIPRAALAAGDLTRQTPVEVVMKLGTPDGQMRFVPDKLEFETGKLYKLILKNPSPHKHYFTSPTLAAKVFTRKVEVLHEGKQLAEIKGQIAEIEVFPGGHSEWWFVPVSTGTFSDLHCHVKEKGGVSHHDMGMTGSITIR